MALRSPSLVELHAFVAVARTGSFRKAADRLFVTQAAVSRAVLRLEEQLGVDVLTRSGAGVRLTDAGAQLLRRVEKPLATLEQAAADLQRRPDRLRLRLSVVTSLGNLWLMPRLEDFRARHPDVELEFRQYHHDEDFRRDDVDLWIALKPQRGQAWPRQIAARYLIGREIVAVCAPGMAARIRSAADLVRQPLLYHSNYPDNWHLWAQASGVSLPPGWGGTGFDLVMNLIGAARSGMGVAVVQKCMVEGDLAAGRLAMPVAGAASTGRGYFLCRRRSLGAHPAVERFSEWVMAQAAEGEHGEPVEAPRRRGPRP